MNPFLRLSMCVLAILAVQMGCSGSASVKSGKRTRNAASKNTSQEHLSSVLSYLNRGDEFDRSQDFYSRLSEGENQSQAREQLLFHLSFWISKQEPDAKWINDPLVQRLPQRFQLLRVLQELAVMRFDPQDVSFLEESKWYRDVSRWVAAQPRPSPLKDWKADSGLSEDDFQRLVLAERYFDWTVRNIQLDRLPPVPKIDPNYKPPANQDLTKSMSPALQGLPGPGYTQKPWETLLFGHGDAWMRARVFIYLCRQAGIDAVMLAVRRGESEVPWAVGVLLDQRAYVFDPALGVALKTADGRGVIDLKKIVDDPKLLDQVQVEGLEYTIKADELKNVGALLDAAPPYLTQKWYVLQRKLTGKNQMVLAYSPTSTARVLNSTPGIRWNRIWDVPLDCLVYVTGRYYRASIDPQISRERSRRSLAFLGLNPLSQARQLHLTGEFENIERETGQQTKPGALARYIEARMSDTKLAQIRKSQALQKKVGLVRQEGEPDASWTQRVMRTELIYQQAKYHATYWIGMIHFERQSFESAALWFGERTMKDAGSPWKSGARYNLGRVWEELGRFEEARQLYLDDDSAQRHGNLLRARMLESKMSTTGSQAKPTPSTLPATATETAK